MKKTVNYMLMALLAVSALSCRKSEGVQTEPLMTGVFYADIPGEKELVEIAPGASRTYMLKA